MALCGITTPPFRIQGGCPLARSLDALGAIDRHRLSYAAIIGEGVLPQNMLKVGNLGDFEVVAELGKRQEARGKHCRRWQKKSSENVKMRAEQPSVTAVLLVHFPF